MPPRPVLLVGYDNAQVLDVACPVGALEIANGLGATPRYAIELAALDGGDVRTSSGIPLGATPGFATVVDHSVGEAASGGAFTSARWTPAGVLLGIASTLLAVGLAGLAAARGKGLPGETWPGPLRRLRSGHIRRLCGMAARGSRSARRACPARRHRRWGPEARGHWPRLTPRTSPSPP